MMNTKKAGIVSLPLARPRFYNNSQKQRVMSCKIYTLCVFYNSQTGNGFGNAFA